MLFYTTINDAWRAYRVHRHVLGTPAEQDVDRPRRRTTSGSSSTSGSPAASGTSRSARHSKITSEVRLLDADDPAGSFRIVAPRRNGVEYSVEHWAHPGDPARDLLFVLHNADGKVDFELASTPAAALGDGGGDGDGGAGGDGGGDGAAWTPLVAHQPGVRLDSVEAFAGHLVVAYRRDGLTGLAVHRVDAATGTPGGAGHADRVPRADPPRAPGDNSDYDTTRYRLGYTSMVTPQSVYDYDVATGELTLLKRQPVLGGYDPDDYVQERVWATADDGGTRPDDARVQEGRRGRRLEPLPAARIRLVRDLDRTRTSPSRA